MMYTVAFAVCTLPQTTEDAPLTLKSSPLPVTVSVWPCRVCAFRPARPA